MKKILLGFFVLSLFLLTTRVFATVNYVHNGKVTICHAHASNSNPYNEENPNIENDGTLQGGHLNHTGPVFPATGQDGKWGDIIPPYSSGNFNYPGLNWTSQGQAIWSNDCDIPSPTPSPSPSCTPSPTPRCTPSPTPSPSPTVTPSPTPRATPTPTPTASPTPSSTPTPASTPTPGLGKQSKTAISDPVCMGQNFDAKIQLLLDGNPVKDVNVKFVYSNEAKYAKTGTDGWAGVAYGYKDETNVEFIPEQEYPTQLQKIVKSQNCVAPTVLGVSTTSGKVLGATTLGKTGAFEDTLMNMVGWMGASLTAVGSFLYAKKKN